MDTARPSSRSRLRPAALLAMLALQPLLGAAPEAKPLVYVFEGGIGGDTLILDLERPRVFEHEPDGAVYEYSGDYLEKKKGYRIFAHRSYYAAMGGFEGWAEDHWLVKKVDENDTDPMTWIYGRMELGSPDGDTLTMSCGILPWWEAGQECHQSLRLSDGSTLSSRAELVSVDPATPKDFPLREGGGGGVTALRRPEAVRRLVDVRPGGLRLEVPGWARAVELYSLDGARVHAAPVEADGAVRLPGRLAGKGRLWVRYLRG